MPTFREGTLPRGAIRSALKATPNIHVFEGYFGPIGMTLPDSEPTDLGSYKKFIRRHGTWPDETAKRNDMLNYARRLYGKQDFWALLLDADELLVWGEYLQDWLEILRPLEGEAVVPIKVTEAVYRERSHQIWTDIGPSHLWHSSVVDCHLVGAWQLRAKTGVTMKLDRMPAAREPAYGEPHIHHRSYLRRGERKFFRAHHQDEQRWLDDRGLQRTY